MSKKSSVFWLTLGVFWSFSEVSREFCVFWGFNSILSFEKFSWLLWSFWGCFHYFRVFLDILDIHGAF